MHGIEQADDAETAQVRKVPLREVAVRLEGLSKLRDVYRYERPRHARNEALNTLIEFGKFFLNARRYKVDPGSQSPLRHVLRDVSVEIETGSVVGVVDLGGASRTALMSIVASANAAHGGRVERRGRTVSLRQLTAMLMPDRTCWYNLQVLVDLLGVRRSRLKELIPEIVAFSGLEAILEKPARRCAPGEFMDLAISTICCLDFDILVADEINQITSEHVMENWQQYLATAASRNQTILVTSRRLASVFDVCSHLLLLENAKLRAYGPIQEIQLEHEGFIEVAVSTPFRDLSTTDTVDDDDDDEAGLDDSMLDFADGGDADILSTDLRRFDGRTASTASKPDGAGGTAALPPPDDSSVEPLSNEVTEIAYITRTSPLCDIAWDGGPSLFGPQGELARQVDSDSPNAASAKDFQVLYREEGGRIRLDLETRVPNLRLRPGLDLIRSKKASVLRMVAPHDIEVPEPAQVTAYLAIPGDLLEVVPYTLSAFVAVVPEAEVDADIAILRNYETFFVDTRVRDSVSDLDDLDPLEAERTARVPVLRTSARLDPVCRESGDVLSMASEWYIPLTEKRRTVDPAGPDGPGPLQGGRLSLGDALVEQGLTLSGWVDFGVESNRYIRFELQPPVELESGHHELTAIIPEDLLGRSHYRIEVSLRGLSRRAGARPARASGHLQVQLEASEPELEEPTLRLLAQLPAPIAKLATDWTIEITPRVAPPSDEEDADAGR